MSELTHIVDLLRQLRDDSTTLVREEITLAKTEAGEKFAAFGRNAVFLAIGALTALSALQFILLGIAFLIRGYFVAHNMNEGTATILGLLIVGAVVGVVAAILVTKALATFKETPLSPTKTIDTLQEHKAWIQQKIS